MTRFWALVPFLAGCGPEEILDVAYDERFGSDTTMDVYLPDGGGESRPAVLLIHGGGWRMGSKENYTDTAQRLASSGFVAATINYRLTPEVRYPDNVQDCVCALSYLRARADDWGLDPDRVAVMGYSAGGHLVSLLGVAADHPDHVPDCESGPTGKPNAVVSGAGPQDLRELPRKSDAVEDLFGGTPDDVPELYAQASPRAHVAPDLPPFLFIHGGGDVFVDVEQSEDMRDALVAQGNEASLLRLSGGGHLFNPSPDGGQLLFEIADDSPEAWLTLVDFLDRSLGAS